MKFDPTINSGTIIQIIVIVAGIFGAWSAMDKQIAAQTYRTDQIEKRATDDRERLEKAVNDLKSSVEKVSASVTEVQKDVAFLRGRAADVGGKK